MSVLDRARKLLHSRLARLPKDMVRALRATEEAKILAAKALIRDLRSRPGAERLRDVEFKVFSQFGDDGIIQYLIHHAEVRVDHFVEFGVEDYTELNTRFLLVNDNWRGLVMDGSAAHVESIKADRIYWRHELTALHAWIDRDNVDGLIRSAGFTGEIGLLSVDLDGNDYWVWELIDAVEPAVVVCEYNSLFGAERALTVPYQADFDRTRAHHSHLYFGASLKALCLLGERKGYAFVGTNGAGNNAYFVRRDRLGAVRPVTTEAGYVASRFRESRDAEGRLTYLQGAARLAAVADLPVFDVERDRVIPIREAVRS